MPDQPVKVTDCRASARPSVGPVLPGCDTLSFASPAAFLLSRKLKFTANGIRYDLPELAPASRKIRPRHRVAGKLDGESFVRVADQFISLANQRNKKIDATELQMVMLFAAARYAAHVGKNVLDSPDQEEFIKHMAGQYADMLRGHLADPNV